MQSTISKEEIKELPLEQFEGRITIVENPDDIAPLVKKLSSEEVIGFDTETKPTFKKGVLHHVSLMQLCTPEDAYLIRVNLTGFTRELAALMANPSVLKAGVGIRDDLRGLQRLRRFKPKGFVELQDMVTNYGIEVFSLKNLAALLLKFRVSKRQQLSNWEATSLTDAQAIYAATDAWVALQLYQKLLKMPPVTPTPKNNKPMSPDSTS